MKHHDIARGVALFAVTPFLIAAAVLSLRANAAPAASAAAESRPAFVVNHVESPAQIGLGTMAVNVWARLGSTRVGSSVGGCTLVLAATKTAPETRIEMHAIDGAFDDVIETAVATLDTYTWVLEASHPYEIRAHEPGGREEVVAKGEIRVKGRLASKDLLLFDGFGAAIPMLGTGAGGFTEGEPIATGVPSGRPRARDWNRDGLVDLIVASSTGEVFVLENRGAGKFEVTNRIVCTSAPVDAAPFDLDRDGEMDLVVVTEMRGLEIHRGGDEQPTQVEALPGAPELLEVADLDGDKRPEIYVSLLGMDESEIQVWKRTGDDFLWSPALRLPAPDGGRGRVTALLSVPAKERKRERLLIGATSKDQGTLESWGVPADTESRLGIVCLSATRFAGELLRVATGRLAGEDDDSILAAVRHEEGAALLGLKEGGAPRRLAILDQAPEAMALADLDGDGDDDLIAAGKDLRLWINVKGESFHEAGESPYLLDAPVVALVPGDLDERNP